MGPALVLDANLIILLVVGSASENAVLKHKRTRAYAIDDFRLLVGIISNYEKIVVAPNVLSEVSNLLSFEEDRLARQILVKFSSFITDASVDEKYVASATASRRDEFRWLGLSDCALLELAKSEIHILTADIGLHLAALKAGYHSVNFTHLIEAARA